MVTKHLKLTQTQQVHQVVNKKTVLKLAIKTTDKKETDLTKQKTKQQMVQTKLKAHQTANWFKMIQSQLSLTLLTKTLKT